MAESNKFRILNPRKFLKRDLVKNSGKISNSRRMALKKMSFFALGINPLVRTIDKALTMPFLIRKQGKALCFFFDNELAWEVDPEKFGRKTSLHFKESKDGFTIQLSNAEYPSTGLFRRLPPTGRRT